MKVEADGRMFRILQQRHVRLAWCQSLRHFNWADSDSECPRLPDPITVRLLCIVLCKSINGVNCEPPI